MTPERLRVAGFGASLLVGAVVLVAHAAPGWCGGRVLTPLDTVTIRILAAPDLNTTVRVEPDGTIAFPYLGRIKAAGLDEDELARRIEQGLIARKVIAPR